MTADLRLVAPALLAWLAAIVLVAVPIAAWPVAVAALAAAAILLRFRRPTVAAAIGALALVACSIGFQQPARAPQALVASLGDRIHVRVVLDETVHEGAGVPVAAHLTGFQSGEDWFEFSAPVVVLGETTEAVLGSELELDGRLVPGSPGERAAFLVLAEPGAKVLAGPDGLVAAAAGLRAGLLAQATSLGGDAGGLLPGLAIGDTSAVPASLDADMKTAALSHLTAVSGANCAIVVGIVMLGGRLLRIPRGGRVAISLVVLAGFVVLVTPEPSVLRAAVMAALVLVALASGRPVRGVPVLALAVLVLVVTDPWLSREYGFVLSVLATTGLIVLAGPLAAALSRVLPRPLAVLVAIPLSAQLMCQPVLVLLDASLPVYGVIANVLAAPAAPIATVAGMIACLLLPVLPGLGVMATQFAWLPAAWVAAVARSVAGLPVARLPWIPGGVGAAVLAGSTLVLLIVVFARGRKRRTAAFALAAAVVAYSVAVAGSTAIRVAAMPSDWAIAACDVGQGDAVLVRSAGEIALVDTGPEPEALYGCLQRLGVGRVDLLVLTHFDLDHVGGTAAVVGRAEHVLVGPASAPADADLLRALRQGGAVVEQVAQERRGTLGGLDWEVMWPPAGGGTEPGNESSVVMRFLPSEHCTDGCVSSVLLGDLGAAAQQAMMRRNGIAPIDVVKVSHHGSADQDGLLYSRLHARLGLIGVGERNRYGHPAPSLLSLLRSAGTLAARTDRDGLVLVAPGENAVRLWTEMGDAGAR